MKELELKDLIELNDEVVGDGLVLTENGVDKYVVLKAGNDANLKDELRPQGAMNVKIVSNNSLDLTEEEFEDMKRQLIDALEAAVRPTNPKDMN